MSILESVQVSDVLYSVL